MTPRSKWLIGNCSAALFCIATLAAGAGPASVPAADTKPLWRFTAASDITFFRLASTDPPRLVVATKDALLFVDGATGKVLWSRDDLRKVPGVHFHLMDAGSAGPIPLARGIALVGDVMHIFDLETGAKLADSGSWSVRNVCCYLPDSPHGLVLALASSADSAALLGIDLQSGAVRWRREHIFKERSNQVISLLYMIAPFGIQSPLAVDSSNLLLYLSTEGPFDINPATGRIVWSGAALKGKEVPERADGYAPMLTEQGVAYVPSEHTLVALKTKDGSPLWPSPPRLPGQIVQMEMTARGLLVEGAKADAKGNLSRSSFLDLLDPATGRSLWPARVTDLKDWSHFTVQGDTAYLAANGKLVSIDLADGSARDIATVTFEGGEQPYRVEARPDGTLLISDHNLLSLGADGSAKYRCYYPAPKEGFLSKVGSEMLRYPGEDLFHAFGRALVVKRKALGVTGLARDVVYMFTTAPDASGHTGVSLVRVNKADGAEAGRVWLTEKSFGYDTDPATDVVYLKQGDRAIVALRFDIDTSLPP